MGDAVLGVVTLLVGGVVYLWAWRLAQRRKHSGAEHPWSGSRTWRRFPRWIRWYMIEAVPLLGLIAGILALVLGLLGLAVLIYRLL